MHWSFDTESGGTELSPDGTRCTDESLKNRVITMAPIGVRKLSEVVTLVADPEQNIYDLWADWFFNSTNELKRVFHVWNLAWEWKPIAKWYESSQWCVDGQGYQGVVTAHDIFSYEIKLGDRIVKFVDDFCHYRVSVDTATKSILQLSKFKAIMENAGLYGKEKDRVEKLHEIWYALGGETREIYLHYAAVDAFCQALCCEHLFDSGRFCTSQSFDGQWRRCLESYDCGLSASGAGAREAKSLILFGRHFRDIPMMGEVLRIASSPSPKDLDKATTSVIRKLDDMWAQHFGTPDRETRKIIERNCRGGLVWGEVGVWQGQFYHYDYKSSYPAVYYFRKLPKGTGYREEITEKGETIRLRDVCRRTCDASTMQRWIDEFNDDKHQIYLLARCHFRLRPRHIPFISVKDCQEEGVPLKRYGFDGSKKVHEGDTQMLLWTLEEWRMIARNYIRSEEMVQEVWLANAEVGFCRPAIELFFEGKEHSVGVEKAQHKLDLNGACHGKFMQKFLTNDVVEIQGWHLHKVGTGDEILDKVTAKTNPLVGLTAMAHARCRLIEHCDIVTEAGYRVLMTDTDSMVTDCPPDVLRELLEANGWPDWLIHKGHTSIGEILGRFDQESPDVPFDEFRCWGLKRYAEFGEGKLRKSAFAGMHDDDQQKILSEPYSEELRWESTGKKWVGECYAIRPHPVEVIVESVFADSETFRDGRSVDFRERLKWVITTA